MTPRIALRQIRDAKYLLIRAHAETGSRFCRTIGQAVSDVRRAEKTLARLQSRQDSDDLQSALNNLWVARIDAECSRAFANDLMLSTGPLSNASTCARNAESFLQRWIDNNA